MKSILLRLYDGEIYPAEQFNLKTEEYRSLRQKQYQHYEDFIEKLKSLAKIFASISSRSLGEIRKLIVGYL